jgi:hypothetical protein
MVKVNPKYFWTYFNSKKSTNKLPCTMSYFNEEANNGNDIVNLFKSYFSSVYEVKLVDLSINNTSPNLLDCEYEVH